MEQLCNTVQLLHQQVQELNARLQQPVAFNASKIKLNIGGKLFVTSMDTLVSEKPSFFSAWFSEQFNHEPDADGKV